MYLNNSNSNIFCSEQRITKLKDVHSPYFLLRWDKLTDDAKRNFESYTQTNTDIIKVGNEEEYESSVRFTATTRDTVMVKKIYVKYPSLVPTVSDELFKRYRNHGCELYQFDISYRSLVLLENCGSNVPEKYMFNTNNKDEVLKVLSYDIETLSDGTICILGYSSFDIIINSYFDITKEESRFDIVKSPNWEDVEVKQLIAKPENEHKLLYAFAKLAMSHDVVSGHNVVAFDNREVAEKINYHIEKDSYNKQHLNVMYHFLKTYTENTKMFNMGKSEEGTLIYPNSLDTLLAFRRLYFNLPSYTLKNLAKEFNINIKDRVYFESTDFNKMTKDSYDTDLFKKFIKYNVDDVREQNGLTLIALPSILAMSFLTCSPLDEVVLKSNTRMGDNITISRSLYRNRIFPPTINANRTSKELIKQFDKYYLTQNDLLNINIENRDLLKVAKYGDECPQFCYHPGLLLNSETVGGLTQKPDEDGTLPSADSTMLPWYKIVNADVGAMYPSLVRAKNAVSDSVRFALLNETPNDFIWIKEVDEQSEKDCVYHIKDISQNYQKSGLEVGIIVNQEIGLLSGALDGIITLTTKIKRRISEEKDDDKLKSLKGLYASLKAVRNSMTHGMVLATTVSCRSTNLASGSLIVTYANKIMYSVWLELKQLE